MKYFLFVSLFSLIFLVGFGCQQPANNSPESGNKIIIPSEELVPAKEYTADQVAEHAGEDDCWIIIDQVIYDVTEFAPSHPAGAGQITQWCGQNATAGFNTKNNTGSGHNITSKLKLDPYFVGNLSE